MAAELETNTTDPQLIPDPLAGVSQGAHASPPAPGAPVPDVPDPFAVETLGYIPAEVAALVWDRDGFAGCAFVDEAGQRCGRRNFLELEPTEASPSGEPTVQNLRLVCPVHRRHTGAHTSC